MIAMVTHVERLRVRWVDTDASGRIHYTAAFRYFEIAEWELFRKAGVSLRTEGSGFPRVAVSATFHVPLYVDDEIAVHVSPERIGTTSVTFAFKIFRGDTQCVSGQVTAVWTGAQGHPAPLPEGIRTALLGNG
ncbi:MAG: acyl-CoA thioesterase [Candidatus Binatia bacterium]|nr:acyl-CoA thioesterase [Candidatus Binatia bacterium]